MGEQLIVPGLIFAGTSTKARAEMREFLQEVLGMVPTSVQGVEADRFDLPDGSSFAVPSPQGMGATERSLGFLVDDLDQAVADLVSAEFRSTNTCRATSVSAMCTSRPRTGRCTNSSNACSGMNQSPPSGASLVVARGVR